MFLATVNLTLIDAVASFRCDILYYDKNIERSRCYLRAGYGNTLLLTRGPLLIFRQKSTPFEFLCFVKFLPGVAP
jgi:hypothetical protein